MKLHRAQVAAYLSERFHAPVEVIRLGNLSELLLAQLTPLAAEMDQASAGTDAAQALKTFGYGKPVLVECRVDGKPTTLVIHTAATNQFGHEQRSDRAAEMLLCYDTYNQLPNHAPALDVGVVTHDDQLLSVADGDEFFVLTEYVQGEPYAKDLQRLRNSGEVTGVDLRRARQLALYLAKIHAVRQTEPALYLRRIRDTLGSGQGIMGLIDSYPANNALVDWGWLEELEKTCVKWRWQLKRKTHRLAQVHGDFHPFNILFDSTGNLHVLDRSRGAWGEPADDVVCLAINYLFFSLQRNGRLTSPFEQLWNIFWNTYLNETNDHELLAVVAPFFAWRALVLASPLWYNVTDSVRYALLGAARAILQLGVFDPTEINAYMSLGDEVLVG
ncbi:MAG: phosphotransferase [Caldilineaceae bacterium]